MPMSAAADSENKRMNTTFGWICSGIRPQAGALDFNSLLASAQPSGRALLQPDSCDPVPQFGFRRVVGQLHGPRMSRRIVNRLQLAHVMRCFDEIGTDMPLVAASCSQHRVDELPLHPPLVARIVDQL